MGDGAISGTKQNNDKNCQYKTRNAVTNENDQASGGIKPSTLFYSFGDAQNNADGVGQKKAGDTQ